jgi:hypothetical protein
MIMLTVEDIRLLILHTYARGVRFPVSAKDTKEILDAMLNLIEGVQLQEDDIVIELTGGRALDEWQYVSGGDAGSWAV